MSMVAAPLVVGAAVASWVAGNGSSGPSAAGTVRYVEIPVVMLPLPAVERAAVVAPTVAPVVLPEPPAPATTTVVALPPLAPAPEMLALAEPAVAAAAAGPPAEADAALLEDTANGPVPRIAADGRWPLQVYARGGASAAPRACSSPCVALLVTGLGLAQEISALATGLPSEIGLSFSPYADAAADWSGRARRAGHEVLLELPLEPEDFPRNDTGPLTLRIGAAGEAGLLPVLARAQGYLAVAAPAGAFATAPRGFATIARSLVGRGLGFVELGGTSLRAVARTAGLPYLSAMGPIDAEPSPEAIDRALVAIEAEARRGGRALGFAGAVPVSLARIAAWVPTLPGKGLRLVPPGTLLAGSEAGAAPAETVVKR
jgi:polysaccharide deacetylase 2 family uncharacterized protein YibQ